MVTIGDLENNEIESIHIEGITNIPLIKGEQGEKGDKGDKGETNNIKIGTVETGEKASATLEGESPNQILNLVLPKGDKGEQGEPGIKPVKGIDYFTEEEIQEIKSNILDQVNQFSVLVVEELPTDNIDEHTIYFLPKTKTEQNDVYDEFIYINNGWEHIGTTEVDLSSYYKKDEVDKKLSEVEGNEVYIGNEEEAPETAKIIIEEDDFEESAGLSKAEVYVGAEEPVAGEKVWFRKGKNILQNKAESVTNSGVTCSNNLDGSISISGTNTSQIAYCIGIKKIDVSNIKKGIYTISFKNDTAISSVGIRLRKCSSTGKTEIYTTTLNTVNKSGELDLLSLIDNETLYIELDVILYNTINYNVKIYPQVQAGKETPYEAYIEPQIFVRNSNGVYEEFTKNDNVISGQVTATTDNVGRILVPIPLGATGANVISVEGDYFTFLRPLQSNKTNSLCYLKDTDNMKAIVNTSVTVVWSYIK